MTIQVLTVAGLMQNETLNPALIQSWVEGGMIMPQTGSVISLGASAVMVESEEAGEAPPEDDMALADDMALCCGRVRKKE